MSLPFEMQFAQDWPADQWSRRRLILAVSGGADSVALLRAVHARLLETGNSPSDTLLVAHFHHGWRGATADRDQKFVATLAKELQLRFHTARSLGITQMGGMGREAGARRERYAFLLSAAEEFGARYVVTAHTAS